MDPRYFAALSISSLDSDEQLHGMSDYGSNITQTEMYQQLNYIEEIANNFFLKRPMLLMNDQSSFSEVESGSSAEFELRVLNIAVEDVITLTIECIPDCMWSEDSYLPERRKTEGVDYHALSFALTSTSDAPTVQLRPVLYNGEYCITLSTAHGLVSGTYVLSVSLASSTDPQRRASLSHAQYDSVQTIRVTYGQRKAVRAALIDADTPVRGEVVLNQYHFYRFMRHDRSRVLSICVRALDNGDEQHHVSSDPDLHVTNRFEGLVGCDRDFHTWRGVETGSDRIDIYPDDMRLSAGGDGDVFVIGVLGAQDANQYELVVTAAPVRPVTALCFAGADATKSENVPSLLFGASEQSSESGCQHRALAAPSCRVLHCPVSGGEQYAFYSLQLDPSRQEHIVVALHPISQPDCDFGSVQAAAEDRQINLNRGRAVYVSDALHSQQHFQRHNGSSSSAGTSGELVYVYLSAITRHPTAENHTWKTAAVLGGEESPRSLVFIVASDEWRYCADTCYFSVRSNAPLTAQPVNYTLSLTRFDEAQQLAADPGLQARHQLFHTLFARVDGHLLSQTDRASYLTGKAGSGVARGGGTSASSGAAFSSSSSSFLAAAPVDEVSLTYCESDFLPFVELLARCGARDGHVLYDLGCGAGRAVVAAALSGRKFMKCVGVEVLPSLARSAAETVRVLKGGNNVSPLSADSRFSAVTYENESNPDSSSKWRMLSPEVVASLPLMEIRTANFLDTDWSDGDLVCLTSNCLSDSLLQAAVDQGGKLRPGARLLTLRLPERFEALFALEATVPAKMQWGRCDVYVLVRRAQPAPPTDLQQ